MLSKTEQKILAEIAERGRAIRCSYHGYGAAAGRISGGSRGFAAALKLIAKGLARQDGETSHSIHYKNGYAVHSSEIVLR